MKLESGQALSARFVLVRHLGSGGTGETWLAQDHELGRLVAVKVLDEQTMASPAVARAIEQACDRARGFEHQYVLRTHGLHRHAGRTWIAMEYAAGGDLSAFRGRPAGEVLRFALPVARALAYLHELGLAHRDVKPANVLLMGDGTPRLGDFACVLEIGTVPTAAVSRGSPRSASAEQLAGGAATIADDVHGFGALLYELLTGRPPFEAELRRGDDAPRPLAAVHPLPDSLRHLVDRCLAARPGDRPHGMTEVAVALEDILAELRRSQPVQPPGLKPPALSPPGERLAPLRPEWRRSVGGSGPTPEELRRQGFRRGLVAAALVLLLLGAGVVFFVLPDWVAERRPPTAAPASPPQTDSAPEQSAEPPETIDLEALARAKREAEEKRGALEERMQALAGRAVSTWGGAQYERATQDLSAGDESFADRRYDEANELYDKVSAAATTLERQAGEVLAQSLREGNEALQAGRSADARRAFELALAIDQSSAAARKGLARAGTLDQVLELIAQATEHESAQQWQPALDAYSRALSLDADTRSAAEGRDRVRARMAGESFAASMARGFLALDQRDYAAARREFEAAGRIRPASPEVAAALAQLEEEERTVAITAALGRASEHERAEQWQDALKEYRDILALDDTVVYAQQGLARSEPRARLHEELELYLTQPERLFSPSVRTAARDALARAQQIPDAGPVLRSQLARLDEWIRRAEAPVEVALVSDNETKVTVFRVGELGAFERRSLELKPGRYTAVGTRAGYRDVRREFTVLPGEPPPPIVIRCEERI